MKNSTSREVTKLEAAMAERPPIIEWRLDPVRRVQVAWFVDDPYMEHGPAPEQQAGLLRYHAQRKAAS